MSETLEYCFWCNQPTERAGKDEDSIYLGEIGPFCLSCYREMREALIADDSELADLRRDRKRLEWLVDNLGRIERTTGTCLKVEVTMIQCLTKMNFGMTSAPQSTQ